jgi:hypothetical protein
VAARAIPTGIDQRIALKKESTSMAQSPWRTGGSGELPGTPWIKFDSVNNKWGINLQGAATAELDPIPFLTQCVLDYLRLCRGPMRWNPRDVQFMVPIGFQIPELPGPEYRDGMAIPILFEGFPLAKFTSTSAYVNTALFAAHLAYTFAAEAQAGQLPICAIEQGEPIWNAAYNQHYYAPKLKLIGWTDRNPDVFGPPLVRPPSPMLSDGAANLPWAAQPAATPAVAEKVMPPAAASVKTTVVATPPVAIAAPTPPRKPVPAFVAAATSAAAPIPSQPASTPVPPPAAAKIFGKAKATPKILPVP